MSQEQTSGDRVFDLAINQAKLAQALEDTRKDLDDHIEHHRETDRRGGDRYFEWVKIVASAVAGAIVSHYIR